MQNRLTRWGMLALLAASMSVAQAQEKSKKDKHPENWFNLDLKKDGVLGISTEKAYQELLKNKKPKQKVLVAIIDSGVDTAHQDLKTKVWDNAKEVAGNGIDDDNNGYIDDVHGWSFLGSAKGNLTYDNVELVRLMRYYKPKYEGVINDTDLDSTQKNEFKLYKKLLEKYGEEYNQNYPIFGIYQQIKNMIADIKKSAAADSLSMQIIEKYKPAEDGMSPKIYSIVKKGAAQADSPQEFDKEIEDGYKHLDAKINYQYNIDYDQRAELIGDNYDDSSQKNYGNTDVKGPDAFHGTHVAGIIGADRNNALGIKGIADHVQLMSIRTVPDGDERDKDVANAIRYAVDNGAKVVNMSFGKAYKWNKRIVDEAVKYAEEKGVLLVHAAGNENNNNDVDFNYPNRYIDSVTSNHQVPELNTYLDQDSSKLNRPMVSNWIEVGASDSKNDETLKASFSNYGKKSVDVFAPGVKIHSTVPEGGYEDADGTSMAAPVVAGLSALILSYYPELTPKDVRYIIMESVTKIDHSVKMKDKQGQKISVPFADLCITGGVVNAYNALKLASQYKVKKKK